MFDLFTPETCWANAGAASASITATSVRRPATAAGDVRRTETRGIFDSCVEEGTGGRGRGSGTLARPPFGHPSAANKSDECGGSGARVSRKTVLRRHVPCGSERDRGSWWGRGRRRPESRTTGARVGGRPSPLWTADPQV